MSIASRAEARGREPPPEGLSLDVLHRDVLLTLAGLAEREDRADVRVVERGGRTRLLFEPLHARRITREVCGKDLHGDVAAETCLSREPHVPHPSRAELADDLVGVQP